MEDLIDSELDLAIAQAEDLSAPGEARAEEWGRALRGLQELKRIRSGQELRTSAVMLPYADSFAHLATCTKCRTTSVINHEDGCQWRT